MRFEGYVEYPRTTFDIRFIYDDGERWHQVLKREDAIDLVEKLLSHLLQGTILHAMGWRPKRDPRDWQ